jgi:hypothetical protein
VGRIYDRLIIFPFLFSIFPIILLYSENVTEIRIDDFIIPLIITLLVTLSLFTVLKFILKNSLRSGFITTLLAIMFFSYGYIFNVLQTTFLYDFDLIHHRYVMIPFMTVFIVGTYYFIKSKKNLNNFRQIFNVISVVMILSVSVNIITFNLENNDSSEIQRTVLEYQTLQNQTFPDIYHIVLDEYTSNQVLQEDFQYNNSDFVTVLEDLNFLFPSNPLSNYPSTEPFLSSVLNMRYLEDSNLKNFDRIHIEETIVDNSVMQFLKNYNYKIIVPYSGYGAHDKFLKSDENSCSDVIFLKNRFLTELSRTTIINYFIEKQIENERRHIQLCTLSQLPEIGEKYTEPVYVFAHLFIPHAPYLFDKEGNSITPSSNKLKGLLGWNNTSGYLNEIEFINKKMINISTEILTHSNNSIIIIQGDTGSSILNNPNMDDFVKKRLSILFAIHFPDSDKEWFPNTTTSANIYRIIFNQYFESNYELLPDRYFYNSNYDKKNNTNSEFIEVTNMIISK